jgi:hypothetical protein
MRGDQPKARERHNASADEQMIDHGACGQKHLPTGSACIRPVHHAGTCDFRPPPEVRGVADGTVAPLPS